jgi:AraC family transcriptional regulator
MSMPASENAATTVRALSHGEGWRVVEVTCRSGPADRPYEERHAWTSIAAVMSGAFTYRSSSGRALMISGSLLLGSAGTCFECGHEHGIGDRCVAFQFAPDLIEETAAALQGVTRTAFRTPRIPPLDRLLPKFAQIRALTRSADGLRAEELALSLAKDAFALDQEATETPPQAREERRVALAVRIIEARHTEKLTIAGLARDVGMSRRRFASVFRHVVGATPYQYVLNLRLDSAARRLGDESSSVLDIALDAGFGDLSEFTRRFHARFGKPPALYRRGFTGRPLKPDDRVF